MATPSAVDPFVVVLSSSDDDDEIAGSPAVVAISSEEEEEVEVVAELRRGNSKKKKRKRKRRNPIPNEIQPVVELNAVADSVVTEATEVSDNSVLRNLLVESTVVADSVVSEATEVPDNLVLRKHLVESNAVADYVVTESTEVSDNLVLTKVESNVVADFVTEATEVSDNLVLRELLMESNAVADSVVTEATEVSDKFVLRKVLVESNALADSVVAEATEFSDNLVLRKLLRLPRYFDPAGSNLVSCYNCGEEGHLAADCTVERQKKPCFVCGLFGHNAKFCTRKCFTCNKGGHFAKDCPNKNHGASQGAKICLRCGHYGHDMPSCINDYSPTDLKEIQCYVCKKFGHLCCADFEDAGSGQISCYSCGEYGHLGSGCARIRGETGAIGTPSLCYACGEEGHFARDCTKKKVKRRKTESSTPKLKHKKKLEEKMVGSKSAPPDIGQSSKKKKNLRCDGWSLSSRKSRAKYGRVGVQDDSGVEKSKDKSPRATYQGDFSRKKPRVRGGWMTEDPDFSARNKSWHADNFYRAWDSGWMSPTTPSAGSHNVDVYASKWRYPISQSPSSLQGSFGRTPNSFPRGNHPYGQHGFSVRYDSLPKNMFWRS